MFQYASGSLRVHQEVRPEQNKATYLPAGDEIWAVCKFVLGAVKQDSTALQHAARRISPPRVSDRKDECPGASSSEIGSRRAAASLKATTPVLWA